MSGSGSKVYDLLCICLLVGLTCMLPRELYNCASLVICCCASLVIWCAACHQYKNQCPKKIKLVFAYPLFESEVFIGSLESSEISIGILGYTKFGDSGEIIFRVIRLVIGCKGG